MYVCMYVCMFVWFGFISSSRISSRNSLSLEEIREDEIKPNEISHI